MKELQVVILAAGIGSRLGHGIPKPLAHLRDGRTILSQQVDNIRQTFGRDISVMAVVGFKHDLIMEAAPDLAFAYNEVYDQTNTAKSLLRAMEVTADRPVLWLNGDVVFHPALLARLIPAIEADQSFVCVNTAAVGEEEIKYTVDEDGHIQQLSKSVLEPRGEAIGINFVSAADKPTLRRQLAKVADTDYFERAIELAIADDGIQVRPIDISDLFAIEVDFPSDLDQANRFV